MRNFITYVLLRQEYLELQTDTEPCETGWASEAIFFITVHTSIHNDSAYSIQVKAQISVDGINWIDHGALPLVIEKDGNYCLKLKEFGGWLRLSFQCTKCETFITTVQLALKE